MARDGDRGATTDDDDGDDADALTTIIISPFKLYFMPLWTAAEASEASTSAAAFHNNRPPFPSSSPIHCWPDKTVISPVPETDEMK